MLGKELIAVNGDITPRTGQNILYVANNICYAVGITVFSHMYK
jgi:hypothetical protein